MSRALRNRMALASAAVVLSAGVTFAQGAATAPSGSQTRQPLEIRGYHVVLLTADSQPAPPVEGLTPPVQKALKDVQAFLPFKGYKLLDSGLILGTVGVTRINGPDGRIFVASVNGGCSPSGCTARLALSVLGEIATKTDSSGTSSTTIKDEVLRGSVDFVPGEPVVVGSSRVTSDSGLVAILTGLPKK